jgi:hypothetical protein
VPTTRELARGRWLRGLAVGDPVRVVRPGPGGAVEVTQVAVVRPNTLEVAGRCTHFARHSGVARGQDERTGLRLEPLEVDSGTVEG